MQAGPMQILVVLLLILLLFGAKKIPDIARSLGMAKGEFKKGIEEGNKAVESSEESKEEAKA